MKILFFIGTLSAGGKERRLIELLGYLKTHTSYDLILVVRRDLIEYPAFYELKIPYIKLTDVYKKGDKTLHFRFYKLCKIYQPDIVHTWGSMPAFVSLLAIILLRIPHINSQITDAPPDIKKWSVQNVINKINFRFSTIILSNSYAGLKAYNTENRKSKVIYNGINLERFDNLQGLNQVKLKYGIKTTYSVIMVASFSDNKDYDKFIDIAKEIPSIRNDVTFIAVGNGIHLERMMKRVSDDHIKRVVFTGKINDVESLIFTTDIGLLFSNEHLHGEGISNTITEYMALAKPVIANNAGGTKEIVLHGINGYLINNESALKIAGLINNLLGHKEIITMGEAGRKLIHESFTIDRIGKEFEKVYKEVFINYKNKRNRIQ